MLDEGAGRGGRRAAQARSRSGQGTIVARAVGGRTVLAAARADSPLRFVQPTFAGTSSAAVCLVTFGGGLVDGDRIEIDVEVERGATLVVFTQASTKVFRGTSSQLLRARVAGTLVLLPDPVAAFAGARYAQRVDVDLDAGGACVLLDGYTSGRAAFGDRWAMQTLDLRTRVALDGRVVLMDALRLDATDGSIADRAGSFDAFATLVAIGRGAAPVVEAIRRDPIAPPSRELVVATSAIPALDCAPQAPVPGAMLRVAAASQAMALAVVRSRLRNLPDIDAVDPFESRY